MPSLDNEWNKKIEEKNRKGKTERMDILKKPKN